MKLPVMFLIALLSVPAAATACDSQAFNTLRQLVGEWEVSRNGTVIGILQVRAAPSGCALIEEWSAADGTLATALHWPERKTNEDGVPYTTLYQVYIDNRGWVMKADGRIENGALVYEGRTTLQEQDVVLRATIHGLGTDEVVHIGDVSKDDGAHWQHISTLHYERKP